jgi:cytochrome c553
MTMTGDTWGSSAPLRIAGAAAIGLAWMALTPACATADPGEVEALVGAVCQSCHMIDGNSVVPMFPKLAGQQPHYIESQLEAWRTGRRPIEVMDPIRDQVKPRDFEALAEYFASKTTAPGVVTDPTLAEAGRLLYLDGNEDTGVPACEACHQWDGEGNDLYPRLAGQHQAYTIKALEDFRSGARISDRREIMNKIAGRMTDEEIRAVAEHIAGLSGGDQETS